MALSIAAMCGSLRSASFNRSLLEAFARRSDGVFAVTEVPIRDFPLFDQDVETGPFPAPVVKAKRTIAAADCLLLVSPEHDFTVPAVLKNAVEWLSRPHADPTLIGKPMALMGASTGYMGTCRAQIAWRASWHYFKAPVFSTVELTVPNAAKVFDEDRVLVDPFYTAKLDEYIAALERWLLEMRTD